MQSSTRACPGRLQTMRPSLYQCANTRRRSRFSREKSTGVLPTWACTCPWLTKEFASRSYFIVEIFRYPFRVFRSYATSSCSTRLVLLGLHSTGRLARNRLLSVLLAAAQQLQVSSPACQRLLCDSLKARGVFLVDGLSPNERRLLRLNDLVAGLNAL